MVQEETLTMLSAELLSISEELAPGTLHSKHELKSTRLLKHLTALPLEDDTNIPCLMK